MMFDKNSFSLKECSHLRPKGDQEENQQLHRDIKNQEASEIHHRVSDSGFAENAPRGAKCAEICP